ncbi:hypothetical protein HFD88_003796 [Aspergillus terreus]|nr:hypothetical protein HFD88_003796 [Aspergillus terreus]
MTTPTCRPQTWTKGDYLISTDISLISLTKLNTWFASDDLYWASSLPLDALQQTIQSSLCFGLYHNPPQQDDSLDFIGIARCVTDYTTFVYITDVYVDASHRGNGLGSWLVECVGEVTDAMPHLRRSMLFTSDWMRSVPFYEKILGMSVQESKIGEGMAMMMRKGRGYPQYTN